MRNTRVKGDSWVLGFSAGLLRVPAQSIIEPGAMYLARGMTNVDNIFRTISAPVPNLIAYIHHDANRLLRLLLCNFSRNLYSYAVLIGMQLWSNVVGNTLQLSVLCQKLSATIMWVSFGACQPICLEKLCMQKEKLRAITWPFRCSNFSKTWHVETLESLTPGRPMTPRQHVCITALTAILFWFAGIFLMSEAEPCNKVVVLSCIFLLSTVTTTSNMNATQSQDNHTYVCNLQVKAPLWVCFTTFQCWNVINGLKCVVKARRKLIVLWTLMKDGSSIW